MDDQNLTLERRLAACLEDKKSKSVLRRLNVQYEEKIAQLEAELDKWCNWKPDDEDLADMQEQAQCRDGSYNSGLAACGVYIGGLEYRVRELEAENERLRGEPCSVCGQQPSVLIDKGHKETYWKCHGCIREDIHDALKEGADAD